MWVEVDPNEMAAMCCNMEAKSMRLWGWLEPGMKGGHVLVPYRGSDERSQG